jgi:catechol 2,3-dioxygenase-like lactoylglutathione lyase family enzyme
MTVLSDRRVHATIPVNDLDAARRFYQGTLGFSEHTSNRGAVLYQAGQGTLFAVTKSSGKASGSHTQMGFTVDDIDAEVADLKRRGVVFEEYDVPGLKTVGSVAQTGPNRAAWFKDPEGNLIGLISFADGA